MTKPKKKATQKSNFLREHLIKVDGHCGRKGWEIRRLAELSDLSVHMLQSAAYGRKELSAESAAKVKAIIGRRHG